LGIDETPAATHLPWLLSDPTSSRRFQNVEEAFDSFQGNLLLLGAPGSGKTTTLLHIRRRLLDEAENDPDAPVPLLVNLSQFRINIDPPKRKFTDRLLRRSPEPAEPEPEECKRRLKRWLIDELARWPGVTSEIARRWFEEKRVAVLMDGLDEVGASYRADLVRLLNEAYLTPLKDYPDAVVVVCSRINEYLSLQDNPLQDDETRLQLRGAVTLQPLTREQIESYLDAAQATGLREAFPNDAVLYEIAQTPLTLSMMVLAYGGLAPKDIPAQLSLSEHRYHLMEAYVARMLQRKERRDCGRPFRAGDVLERDYRYRPDLVNRFLNWLAVRLNVRMQTAVSMDHFHEFLTWRLEQEREKSVALCVGIARSVFMFLGILILGTTLMPASPEGFLWVAGIGLVLMSFECVGSASVVSNLASHLINFIMILGLPVLFIAGLGVASRAIAAVVPGGASPYTSGAIAACAVAMLLSVIWMMSGRVNEGVAKRIRLRMVLSLVALDAMSPIITIAATHLLGRPDLTTLALAAMLVATLVVELVLFDIVYTSGNEDGWIILLMISIRPMIHGMVFWAALLGCQLVGTWVVGSLDWYEALAVIASVAFVLHSLAESLYLSTGLVLIATLGGAIGGGVYAVLGTVLFLVLAAVIEIASADDGVLAVRVLAGGQDQPYVKAIKKATGSAEERIRRVAERFVLTPVVLCVIALTHGFPLRWARFLDYTTDALLLKRSGPTTKYVEFMHRLLRDYFVLRNLQPLLSAKDRERQLDAIRKLGFLGDSAIDSLADLARDPDPLVREVAISAVGMMSAPGAVRILEETLVDREPIVRRASVLSLGKLVHASCSWDLFLEIAFPRLIALAQKEQSIMVNMALVDTLVNSRHWWPLGTLVNNSKIWMQEVPDAIEKILENTEGSNELLRKVVERVGQDPLRGPPLHLLDSEHWLPRWAQEMLPALLWDGDPNVRAGSLILLDRRQKREHIEVIIHRLWEDVNVDVRAKAAEALGRFGDPRVVELLILALRDPEEGVRAAAAEALGRLGDAQAVEPLILALRDPDVRVRAAAAEALGRLGDPRAVEPLILALRDPDVGVRAKAAEALGRLGDPRAVEPLIEAQADQEMSVWMAATIALNLPPLSLFRQLQSG
jgi:HEAT repeat protein